MKRFHWIGALAVAFGANSLAIPSEAQDYTQLMEDGRTFAELALSIQSCRHFGYETRESEATALAQARVRRAIMDGLDGSQVETLFLDALHRKAEDLKLLSDGLNDTSSPERWARYAGEFTADWVDRCERMNRAFPTAVVSDGDEGEATAEFRRRMEARLIAGQ